MATITGPIVQAPTPKEESQPSEVLDLAGLGAVIRTFGVIPLWGGGQMARSVRGWSFVEDMEGTSEGTGGLTKGLVRVNVALKET